MKRFITWQSAKDGKRPVEVTRLFSHRGLRLMLHRAPKELHWDGEWGVSHEPSGSNVARASTPLLATAKAKARIDRYWDETHVASKRNPIINPNARRDALPKRRVAIRPKA